MYKIFTSKWQHSLAFSVEKLMKRCVTNRNVYNDIFNIMFVKLRYDYCWYALKHSNTADNVYNRNFFWVKATINQRTIFKCDIGNNVVKTSVSWCSFYCLIHVLYACFIYICFHIYIYTVSVYFGQGRWISPTPQAAEVSSLESDKVRLYPVFHWM